MTWPTASSIWDPGALDVGANLRRSRKSSALPDIMYACLHRRGGQSSPTAHWRDRQGWRQHRHRDYQRRRGAHLRQRRGVITNPPHFPWQVVEPQQLYQCAAWRGRPRLMGDLHLKSFGYGLAAGTAGRLLAAPRFVRAAFFRSTAPPPPRRSLPSRRRSTSPITDISPSASNLARRSGKIPDIPQRHAVTAVRTRRAGCSTTRPCATARSSQVDEPASTLRAGVETAYVSTKGVFHFRRCDAYTVASAV